MMAAAKAERAVIRSARCDDVDGIAHVHVASWRTTYRGMMPDAVLAALSVERRAVQWRRRLCEEGVDDRVFVAERAGAVVGFASLGPPDEDFPEYSAELQTVYLLAGEQGRGTGHRLFQAAFDALGAAGGTSVMLWVLRDNARARRFYEAHGGAVIGEKPTERGGATIIEVAYGWQQVRIPQAMGENEP